MRYFVNIEMMETSPTSPQELIPHLERVVIPHYELFMKLEAEGKILASGAYAGERAGAFIIDVDSNDELDQLLMSIPGWESFKIDVTPLQSHENRIKMVRQILEHLKTV